MPFTAKMVISFLAIFAAFHVLSPASARASEAELVSTMELMHAYAAVDGIQVVPATDVPLKVYTEDYSPSQVLEIIRPNQEPITVGRLATSCACLRASLPKQSFAQGERALIEVRNIKATPANGATFAIFVQLVSPQKLALQYDIFAKSTRKPGDAAPVVAAPAHPVGEPVHAAPMAGAAVPARNGQPKSHPFKYEDIVPYTPKAAPQPAPQN